MELTFNPEDMTVGEMCEIADVAGDQAVADFAKGTVAPKVLLAMAWIAARRTNPDFTLDDARKIKVVDLNLQVSNGNGAAPAETEKPT